MTTDSHDTTQSSLQGDPEKEKDVTETSENLTEKDVSTKESDKVEQSKRTLQPTKENILKRLNELCADAENTNKQELDNLKLNFYKLHNAEWEEDRKQFVEATGTEEGYIPKISDKEENEFKRLMAIIKEKRNKQAVEIEKQKEGNLKAKLSIIGKLKELVETSEDANRSYNDFKKLQQEWNEIKQVPQNKVNELWRSYQLYVEKFYDILKLNNEFRDYDFKKNLELKIKLCEAVERLSDQPDVISAFHQLQKLHQEFRETGPVTRDLRNEIWNRFKTASTTVNRRHQQHFDQLKEVEQQNLDQKTVICEIVEAIEYANLTSFAAWEDKTREVIALQNKWKTIGFAPQKMNVKIFERFRKACDEFFSKKGEFFKGIKEGMSENLKKKEALCEKAEALKDSTDWKESSDILIKLQKEWKTIGSVSRKHSDVVWKRFITACDYFFEQKGKVMSSLHSEEVENLALKKAIIHQLATMDESAGDKKVEEEVRKLVKEWGKIGHVPFREKDKLYEEFNSLVDKRYERLHISISDKKLHNFKSSLSNLQETSQSLYKEREKLVRTHDHIKNDIQVYENNLGFFTSSSKKGENLLVEANRKIEKLKDDLDLISQKIQMINEEIEKES
ncbi:hypothetical protein EZS27_000237 [termite gut metagenome]|uniref:DUF349 domain-containing protein n=1 Tax=termite gut metagenome TaxID=433724 RepID=A0A5J4T578_9ZZZZ